MRSLLFVPADGGPKLDKALASGADAVIVDLEDSIVPERKPVAREAALAFLKKARPSKQRPRLLVRINGLDTGMTDADLDAIVAGRTPLSFPKPKVDRASFTSMPSSPPAKPSPGCPKGKSRFWRKLSNQRRGFLPPAISAKRARA
jgi:hypothetical protein